MADDLNLRFKIILSMYNIYPSGNITEEDIYVSFTMHISEFVCCLQREYAN